MIRLRRDLRCPRAAWTLPWAQAAEDIRRELPVLTDLGRYLGLQYSYSTHFRYRDVKQRDRGAL